MKKGKIFFAPAAFLLFCLRFWAPLAASPAATPLWDRFWAEDIRQYRLTHVERERRKLVAQASRIGPPPPSDAPVSRIGYAGGTIRALFILPFRDTRYPFELAARFDCLDYDLLPASLFSAEARSGDGFRRDRNFDAAGFESALLDAIEEGRFDVVVASNFDGAAISAAGQARMKQWVEQGLGWVDVGAEGEGGAVRALFPLEPGGGGFYGVAADRRDGHFIVSGLPGDIYLPAADAAPGEGETILAVPGARDRRGRASRGRATVIAARGEGSGRLVSYRAGWPGFRRAYLYPEGSPAGEWVWYRNGGLWSEAEFSLLVRSIIWAAGRETPFFARVPEGWRPGIDATAIPLSVSRSDADTGRGAAAGLRVTWQLRDETGWAYDGGYLDFGLGPSGDAELLLRPGGRLQAGHSELFYEIRDAGGRLVAWGEDVFRAERALGIREIILPEFFERRAGRFTGRAVIENRHPEERPAALALRLLDSHARRLPFAAEFEAVIAAGGETAVEFELPADFEYLFGPMGFLHLELSGGAPGSPAVERRKVPFFAPRPPAEALEDWQVGVSAGGQDMFWPAYARVFRAYGFNTAGRGAWRYPDDLLYLSAQGFNLYTEYLYTRLGHFSRTYGENTWFWDPETRQGDRRLVPHWTEEGAARMESLVARAASLRRFGVIGYGASQEIGLGPEENCLSAPVREFFRAWALEKHGGLEELNAAWGTAFRESGEIRGILIDEALALTPGNPAWWLDFRQCMEEIFNSRLEAFTRAGREVVPEAFWGYNCGPYREIPTQGHNRARLGRTITQSREYLGPWLNLGSTTSYFDVLRSRRVPALIAVTGYPSFYQDPEPQYENNAWYTALYGGSGVTYYSDIHPPWWAKNDGTGAPLAVTGLIRQVNADLSEGLGRLIIGSERGNSGIGIYQSRASGYVLSWRRRAMLAGVAVPAPGDGEGEEAARLRDDPGGGEGPAAGDRSAAGQLQRFGTHGFGAMRELALAAGFSYDLVFEDQLLAGELEGRYRVLMLPGASCLSGAELEALRRFAAAGGLLVVDMETGYYDGSGRPNPLIEEVDALFGVARERVPPAFEPVAGELEGGGRVEGYGTGAARAAAGRALTSFGGRDALVLNEFGDGRTLYLNMVPKMHGNWDNPSRDPLTVSPDLRRLFIRLAETAGAERAAVLEADGVEIPGLDHVDAVRFSRGGNQYLFLHSKPHAGNPAVVSARTARPFHVYDMRRRRYLGGGESAPLLTAEPGSAAAFAFLEYRVSGVTIEAPERAAAGAAVTVRVRVGGEGREPGDHVVRLEVSPPGGDADWRFSRNIDASAGSGETVLRFTLDETPGRWRLKARDIASGAEAEGEIVLGVPD